MLAALVMVPAVSTMSSINTTFLPFTSPMICIEATSFAFSREDLLSVAGIDRLITMDLHADQIQGFFNIPVDHLYASAVFLPYIQSLKLDELVIATPDVGGSKRASTFSKYLITQ